MFQPELLRACQTWLSEQAKTPTITTLLLNMNFLDIALIIALNFLIVLFVVFIFSQMVLLFGFWGAIYVPTGKGTVKKILSLAKVKPGERAVDLGSGDGRLVIALAQAGAEAHGYEINPLLVFLARRNIRKAGLSGKAFIYWKSFWKEDFSKFDVVVVFGIAHIMKRLEEKLKKEIKADARVVSNGFPLPTWPQSERDSCVYLYQNRTKRDIHT